MIGWHESRPTCALFPFLAFAQQPCLCLIAALFLERRGGKTGSLGNILPR
jgi:hypothetical protein